MPRDLLVNTYTGAPTPAQADDFSTWTLTDLAVDATTGGLTLAEGETSGTALSPVYHFTELAGDLGDMTLVAGSKPLGSTIRARVRTAATEGGVAAATWSPWVDVFTALVSINNWSTVLANAELTSEEYGQFQIYLGK